MITAFNLVGDCFCFPTHYETLEEAIAVIVFCVVAVGILIYELFFSKNE